MELLRVLLLIAPLFLSTDKTVLDGVYTADQAARGERVFTGTCRGCHRSEFFSSPEALALRGPLFVERWREDSLQSLFAKMKGYMPPANVAPRLPDQDYLDIISFLLQSNAYPAGAAELKSDDLARILFVDQDGPKPVPNLAQVAVVGCLTPAAGGTWTLTNATLPVRTRTPEQSTAEELKGAEARTGSEVFQLRNIDDLPGGFNMDSHKGQKVQAKGVLIRQSNGNRLNLLLMDVVSSTCGN